MEEVRLGMIGAGTVGGGVYRALHRNGSLLASRIGVRFRLVRIAVKALDEPRKVHIPETMLTTNWREVVENPEVDIVIELVGGTTVAKEMVLSALRLGKPVVTANKALLSEHGLELFAAARDHRANIYYEASVAGGIPIIKALREGLVGNRVERIYGIVNGTCNYVLTRMKRHGESFEEALDWARRLGYAEAEPSLDIDGYDSVHKTGLLASLAHGFWISPEQIYREGIRSISHIDIEFADRLGYTIKLLGVVKLLEDSTEQKVVQVAVYPALVPNTHVLANVEGAFNAIYVRGDIVGETLFYGQGAGQDPTASAVLADLADAALDLRFRSLSRVPAFVQHEQRGKVLPIGECESSYYVRFEVIDRPGVLARIATVFGNLGIGISSVIQPGDQRRATVPLIFMTYSAKNILMEQALNEISRFDVVKAKPIMYRVENFE